MLDTHAFPLIIFIISCKVSSYYCVDRHCILHRENLIEHIAVFFSSFVQHDRVYVLRKAHCICLSFIFENIASPYIVNRKVRALISLPSHIQTGDTEYPYDSCSCSAIMKIYTKTGDKGTSSLYNGERRSKTDDVFKALGDVDELNSLLGIAREHIGESTVDTQIQEIQSRLLDVGSCIATPPESSSESKRQRVEFESVHVERLESWIDEHSETLPALTQFILPSGGLAASHLHLARAVCRRAERSVIACYVSHGDQEIAQASSDNRVRVYLNRLSDYLFTIARVCAFKENRPEVTYRK